LLSTDVNLKIFGIIILCAVLHGLGGTWVEYFDNRVLRKTYGPDRKERNWRKLHNEELPSPRI
jgi:hypothetical protein